MNNRRLAGAVVIAALVAGCSQGTPSGKPVVQPLARPAVSLQVTHRNVDVANLLVARSEAVLHHDAAAYLATDDPAAPAAFLAREKAAAAVLMSLDFDSWAVRVTPGADLADSDSLRRKHSAAGAWLPPSTLIYRLSGGDGTPTTSRQTLTFVLRDDRWYVGADDDVAGGDREVWDFGPLREIRGTASLVLAHPQDAALAQALAKDADAAIPIVDAVWGTSWSRRVLIVIPATAQEFMDVARAPVDINDDAAVESAEVGGAGAGTRVVANRKVLSLKTSAAARSIVITHEVTHVATASSTTPGMPTWLIEGFADYVAFGPTGLSATEVAPALATAVAHGQTPTSLPADSAFAGTAAALDLAYGEAWFACRTVVGLAGVHALVSLYRLVGSGTPLATAIVSVTGRDLAAFTATWRGAMEADLR